MNIVWASFKRVVMVWRGKLPLLARLPLVVGAELLTDLSATNTALDQGFVQNLQVARFLMREGGPMAECQAIAFLLIPLYRGQARSHIGSLLNR